MCFANFQTFEDVRLISYALRDNVDEVMEVASSCELGCIWNG